MDFGGKKRFPLLEAYAFAATHGLGDPADSGIMSQFVAEAWPYGATSHGGGERRHCLRIADDYDAFLGGAIEPRRRSAFAKATDASLAGYDLRCSSSDVWHPLAYYFSA
jgi:hypothetical protein